MTDAKAEILEGLKRGERLTALNALIRYHTMALSQRIGDLRREGHPIADEWTKLDSGKRIKTYYWRAAG